MHELVLTIEALISVVGCGVKVSASGWSLFQRSPIDSDCEASIMRRPWPTMVCRAMKTKKEKKKRGKWVVSHCCVYILFAPPYCSSDSQWGRADLRNQWELETSDVRVVESRRWWVLISLTHTHTAHSVIRRGLYQQPVRSLDVASS